MRVKRIILVAFVAVVGVFSSTASADNYGGVSPAVEAKMKALIYKHFGTGWRGQTMVRCARRESGFNPRAANWHDSHGGSFGLFQINGVHNVGYGYATKAWVARMMNPYENIKVAVILARRGGLGPWGGGC